MLQSELKDTEEIACTHKLEMLTEENLLLQTPVIAFSQSHFSEQCRQSMPATLGQRHGLISESSVSEGVDDFELDLEYDCSSLTLDQSIKQVFNILNSVKLPSIEKQQINALQSHISQLVIISNEPATFGKRQVYRKSSGKRDIQTTGQKQYQLNESEYCEQDNEITPFDFLKTPAKGK